ncbi:MAG: hypothetical protein IJU41_04315 [Clostridia bacterium]|nr:hypothetical protein [Clostridia bacterium]
MKIRTVLCMLFIAALVCGVLPLSGGAYAAADGAVKSQAAAKTRSPAASRAS